MSGGLVSLTLSSFSGEIQFCKYQEYYIDLSMDIDMEEGMATHSSILAWRITMDRGAWRATVHVVTKSWTQLKQLSIHIDIDVRNNVCKL